jgi:ribosomal protein L37AE/L43A
MSERLRSCCCFCGSLDIRKVKSLRVYRCNVCHQSFATPSSKMDKSYSGYPLTMSAALRANENKLIYS